MLRAFKLLFYTRELYTEDGYRYRKRLGCMQRCTAKLCFNSIPMPKRGPGRLLSRRRRGDVSRKSHWLRGAKPPLLVLGPRVASWCSLVAIQSGVSPELYPTMITNNQGEARNKRSSVVGEICFGVNSLILIVGLLSSVSSLLTASTDSDCTYR
jgi:hypothetical protein